MNQEASSSLPSSPKNPISRQLQQITSKLLSTLNNTPIFSYQKAINDLRLASKHIEDEISNLDQLNSFKASMIDKEAWVWSVLIEKCRAYVEDFLRKELVERQLSPKSRGKERKSLVFVLASHLLKMNDEGDANGEDQGRESGRSGGSGGGRQRKISKMALLDRQQANFRIEEKDESGQGEHRTDEFFTLGNEVSVNKRGSAPLEILINAEKQNQWDKRISIPTRSDETNKHNQSKNYFKNTEETGSANSDILKLDEMDNTKRTEYPSASPKRNPKPSTPNIQESDVSDISEGDNPSFIEKSLGCNKLPDMFVHLQPKRPPSSISVTTMPKLKLGPSKEVIMMCWLHFNKEILLKSHLCDTTKGQLSQEFVRQLSGDVERAMLEEFETRQSGLIVDRLERDKKHSLLRQKLGFAEEEKQNLTHQMKNLKRMNADLQEEIDTMLESERRALSEVSEANRQLKQAQNQISKHISQISKLEADIKKVNERELNLENEMFKEKNELQNKNLNLKSKEDEIRLLRGQLADQNGGYKTQQEQLESEIERLQEQLGMLVQSERQEIRTLRQAHSQTLSELKSCREKYQLVKLRSKRLDQSERRVLRELDHTKSRLEQSKLSKENIRGLMGNFRKGYHFYRDLCNRRRLREADSQMMVPNFVMNRKYKKLEEEADFSMSEMEKISTHSCRRVSKINRWPMSLESHMIPTSPGINKHRQGSKNRHSKITSLKSRFNNEFSKFEDPGKGGDSSKHSKQGYWSGNIQPQSLSSNSRPEHEMVQTTEPEFESYPDHQDPDPSTDHIVLEKIRFNPILDSKSSKSLYNTNGKPQDPTDLIHKRGMRLSHLLRNPNSTSSFLSKLVKTPSGNQNNIPNKKTNSNSPFTFEGNLQISEDLQKIYKTESCLGRHSRKKILSSKSEWLLKSPDFRKKKGKVDLSKRAAVGGNSWKNISQGEGQMSPATANLEIPTLDNGTGEFGLHGKETGGNTRLPSPPGALSGMHSRPSFMSVRQEPTIEASNTPNTNLLPDTRGVYHSYRQLEKPSSSSQLDGRFIKYNSSKLLNSKHKKSLLRCSSRGSGAKVGPCTFRAKPNDSNYRSTRLLASGVHESVSANSNFKGCTVSSRRLLRKSAGQTRENGWKPKMSNQSGNSFHRVKKGRVHHAKSGGSTFSNLINSSGYKTHNNSNANDNTSFNSKKQRIALRDLSRTANIHQRSFIRKMTSRYSSKVKENMRVTLGIPKRALKKPSRSFNIRFELV